MENNYWDKMTLENLKTNYPTTNDDVLKMFLNDMKRETEYSSIDLSHLNLDMRYPQELLSDFNFGALLSCQDFHETGQADAMQSAYIEDLKNVAPSDNLIVDAEKDLATMEQMPDFYKIVVKDTIDAFKKENLAFKDVAIPFFHPPMPDFFPDVLHNGKTIEAECLGHETVQATNFCLMKDPTDKKDPYFVMAYRIDKIDDTAGYKVQNLNTRTLTEAKSMFADVVAGRLPRPLAKPSIKEQIAKAAEKIKQSTSPAISDRTKTPDLYSKNR